MTLPRGKKQDATANQKSCGREKSDLVLETALHEPRIVYKGRAAARRYSEGEQINGAWALPITNGKKSIRNKTHEV